MLWRKSLILSDLGRAEEAAGVVFRLRELAAASALAPVQLELAEHAAAWAAGDTPRAHRFLELLKARLEDPQSPKGDINYILDNALAPLVRHGEEDEALWLTRHGRDPDAATASAPVWSEVLAEPRQRDGWYATLAAAKKAAFATKVRRYEALRARGAFPEWAERLYVEEIRRLGAAELLVLAAGPDPATSTSDR